MKNAEEIEKQIVDEANKLYPLDVNFTPTQIVHVLQKRNTYIAAATKYASQSRWVKVSERLPEFDVNVLVYWKLEKSKTNGGGYYDMIEIASISSISHGKDWQSVEWRDSEYNSVNPTHWMELPTPPKD